MTYDIQNSPACLVTSLGCITFPPHNTPNPIPPMPAPQTATDLTGRNEQNTYLAFSTWPIVHIPKNG